MLSRGLASSRWPACKSRTTTGADPTRNVPCTPAPKCRLKTAMDTPSYDVIVIGAGPAGLTAATEAARAGLKVLLPRQARARRRTHQSRRAARFRRDLRRHDDGLAPDRRRRRRRRRDRLRRGLQRSPATARSRSRPTDGERHTARAIVVATGLNKGKLGLPDEDEYEGRGLSHCAHCDGPLYAGQPVIVAGAERLGRPTKPGNSSASPATITMHRHAKPDDVPDGVTAMRRAASSASKAATASSRSTVENDGQRKTHSDQCGVRLRRPVSRCGIPAGFACTRRHRAYRCR